ncbi:Uncharacterised protein [Sphingobacterium daejeonense]|nr:Uncharacterised protein [Sphingobacterium daejeonense]
MGYRCCKTDQIQYGSTSYTYNVGMTVDTVLIYSLNNIVQTSWVILANLSPGITNGSLARMKSSDSIK